MFFFSVLKFFHYYKIDNFYKTDFIFSKYYAKK